MKYKYIFFDWGYTLISKFENVDDKINQILEKYNLKWDDIFRKWKNYQILNSLGKVTEKEIYQDLSSILTITEEDLEKIDRLLLESHILENETKETIVKLYKKGYYLGIISNNSIRNVEYILKRENIRKYFKKVVISEEVKERKPNLKIYMKAFEEIPKEEYQKIALVSDELLEDLLAVKILGVKTIWYEQKIHNKWKQKEEVLIEPDDKIKSMKELLDIIE
jgi:HAD superfamily hydrolase (TIGR01549 family)